MGNACEATTATMCYRMRPLVYATGNLTYTMQVSITNTINSIYDLIPDVSSKTTSRRLKTRGLIDAVGQVQSWLFGLTTETQTREMKGAIEKIKGIVDLTAADVSHVKHAMATYTKFENERMNNMKELLEQEGKSMTRLHDIRQLSETSHIEYNVITLMSLELAKCVQLHDSLQQLEFGIEDLLHGQLTPKLISVEANADMLTDVSKTLELQSYVLCFKTPQQVYASQTFDYARHESSLIIRLRLPYYKYRPLNLYRTIVLPLPVRGEQNFVTQLKNVPRYVITNLALGLIGEL
jgi:hypothetical protein